MLMVESSARSVAPSSASSGVGGMAGSGPSSAKEGASLKLEVDPAAAIVARLKIREHFTPEGRPLSFTTCTCAVHCANQEYHSSRCCDLNWCRCWCHHHEYARLAQAELAGEAITS